MKDKKLLKDGKKLLPGSGLSYHKFNEPVCQILQTFENPMVFSREVTFITKEVSALCPLTSQPDWYEIKITYEPDKYCIESKSAKLYFGAFRDYKGFIETLTDKIFHDWYGACLPKYIKVELTMAARGGIVINTIQEQRFIK